MRAETTQSARQWNSSFAKRTDFLQNSIPRFFFADHAKLNQLATGNWQLLIITTSPVATSLWDVRTAPRLHLFDSKRKEVAVGNPQFFAIFSTPVFGEVAVWSKAALC